KPKICDTIPQLDLQIERISSSAPDNRPASASARPKPAPGETRRHAKFRNKKQSALDFKRKIRHNINVKRLTKSMRFLKATDE
ncbi:hypothetical protein, partial [Victivallis lenta]|uniref:hypothetical protein n=1 Tax=Victivallis lenta TaxID=2606640 RepID=UPI003AF1F6AF